MKIFGSDNKELMRVSAIERDGESLILKGKIFGTMPMTAKLTPDQAREAFKLLNLRMILFLVTFLFRRSRQPAKG